MSESYPKSREELLVENRALADRIAALEYDVSSLRAELGRSEFEKEREKRRGRIHKLSPDASDSFQRPFRG